MHHLPNSFIKVRNHAKSIEKTKMIESQNHQSDASKASQFNNSKSNSMTTTFQTNRNVQQGSNIKKGHFMSITKDAES